MAALLHGLRSAGSRSSQYALCRAKLNSECDKLIGGRLLLKAEPTIYVWVVGYRDYVGAAEANMTLAGKTSEDGPAKNRRVERVVNP
jgi:hypothetical protein